MSLPRREFLSPPAGPLGANERALAPNAWRVEAA